MKRCLIISAGVGGGHVRAAQALERAFQRYRPDVTVKHVDALDFVTPALRLAYVVPYLNMVNHIPELWGYLYKTSADKKVDSKTSKIRSIATKLQAAPLKQLIREFQPDHVIATHFLPLDAFTGKAGLKKWPIPVSCVITDYAVHSFWLRGWVDRYFVANDECALSLSRRGFDPAKIQVTGLPTDPAFGEAAEKNDALDRMSTDEGAARGAGKPIGSASEDGRRLRVLLMGGGFGVGHMVEAAKAILGMRDGSRPNGRRVHLTAVAGKNEETRAALQALEIPFDTQMTVFGFIHNVQEEMAKADVLVSKAGGLTVTEALVMGLPMFLLDPIPGQEEHNADMLLEEGAAKKVGSLDALEYKLDRALADPTWIWKMRVAARAIRKPNAAKEIIEAAAKLVHPEAMTRPPERVQTK